MGERGGDSRERERGGRRKRRERKRREIGERERKREEDNQRKSELNKITHFIIKPISPSALSIGKECGQVEFPRPSAIRNATPFH